MKHEIKNKSSPTKPYQPFTQWSQLETTLARVNKTLKERLQALAERNKETLFQHLNKAIEEYLHTYDQTKP